MNQNTQRSRGQINFADSGCIGHASVDLPATAQHHAIIHGHGQHCYSRRTSWRSGTREPAHAIAAHGAMLFLCVNWRTPLQLTGPGTACVVPIVEHCLAAARTQARSGALMSHGVQRRRRSSATPGVPRHAPESSMQAAPACLNGHQHVSTDGKRWRQGM
ncbi:hypothetical protein SETIT_9G501300v2 [Setaria italica]|uniref:Uncharacterized protein n=1 Tax=Setaria italica TaxID=4555 RepID=A0A368SUH6_SETIT|nr:hypothetical protein SETIT_9G501300v2 [Setaria italica]